MILKVLALILIGLLLSSVPASAKGGGRGSGGRGTRGPRAPGTPKVPSIKSPRGPKTFLPKPSGIHRIAPRSTGAIAGSSARVIDGDTFHANGTRFRVRGIDTPELGQPRAEASKQRLNQLLNSGTVTVTPRAVDKFGRTVADVHVDGRNVADTMRAEGLSK